MNLYGVITNGLVAAGFLLVAYFVYSGDAVEFSAGAAAIAALFGFLAWRNWRRPKPEAGAPPTVERPLRLRTALINCGGILAIDVVFFGAPALGMYVGVALILWLLPRILFAWRKPDMRRHRALVALVAAGAIAADIGAYVVYDSIAEKRVIEVADALARYKARQGAYPRQLQNLVPTDLPAIPAAKSGLVMFGEILYLYRESDPGLMYVSFPPFGRKVLNVETRKWEFVD